MTATKTRKRTPPRPRKRPTRESSSAIVEAVLQASALLLARDGVAGLTTNAVARVAGVSVGSLYQYFPDKHAIIAELARDLERRGLTLAMAALDRVREASAREAAWHLVGLLLDPALGHLEARRALLLEVPRAWIAGASSETDGAVEQLLLGLMMAKAAELRPGALERMAFVVYYAIEGVIEAALLADPDLVRREDFRVELFELAWRYFRPGPDAGPLPLTSPAPAEASAIPDSLRARLECEPSRRPDLSPRTSSRGRETVRAILDATARVLTSDGAGALSVRRVAREAGIGLGTLYIHFPNMQAVVAALAERSDRRLRRSFGERMGATRGMPLRESIDAAVRVYADPSQRALRRALLYDVPRALGGHAGSDLQKLGVAYVASEMASRPSIRAGDRWLMSFFTCYAIESVIVAAFLRDSPWLESGELSAELSELAFRYLAAD